MKAIYKIEIETRYFPFNAKEIDLLLTEVLKKQDTEKDSVFSNLIELETKLLYQTTSEGTVCHNETGHCFPSTKVFTVNEVIKIIEELTPAPKSRWEKVKDIFKR